MKKCKKYTVAILRNRYKELSERQKMFISNSIKKRLHIKEVISEKWMETEMKAVYCIKYDPEGLIH